MSSTIRTTAASIASQLARDLLAAGTRGLIYPSLRNPGGICIVPFEDNAVQDVPPGACWRIIWDGSANWTATAV